MDQVDGDNERFLVVISPHTDLAVPALFGGKKTDGAILSKRNGWVVGQTMANFKHEWVSQENEMDDQFIMNRL